MQHPSRHGLVLFAAACFVLTLTLDRSSAQAAPEPAIVNPSWSLDFTFDTPRAVAVADEDGVVNWYWYMPYKVVNHTGQDRLFIPEIIVYNDSGDILVAGRNIPPKVFDQVQHLLNNPLLQNSVEIVGTLRKGEDFAVEGVAIWPAIQDDVDTFSVFVSGIHGETQTIKNPGPKEEGDPDEILLRRTLMLDFEVPGNFKTPQEQPVKFVDQRDVMR